MASILNGIRWGNFSMDGAGALTRSWTGLFSPQEAESNRLCRRLQLKDIIPAEMQRLTKYPLLLENIAKYTGAVPSPACGGPL